MYVSWDLSNEYALPSYSEGVREQEVFANTEFLREIRMDRNRVP